MRRAGNCFHVQIAGIACIAALLAVSGTRAAEKVAAAGAPYKVDHHAPLAATERLVERTADYTQYRVEFNGIAGDRVPGYLYVPVGPPKRRPAVLLQYGSGGNKDFGFHVKFAHEIAAAGFVVLTIDSYLRGERAPKDESRIALLAAQFNRDSFVHYCGDYSRAVDFLVTRPEVDPNRIGYVGISWGAITGITFAAHDPRIKVVVALVAGAGIVGKVLGTSPADRQRITAELDPLTQVRLIAPRPLLMINATNDALIPRQNAEMLHRAAGPNAVVVWVDTDHDFRGPDRAHWSEDRRKIAERVIAFLKQHLAAK